MLSKQLGINGNIKNAIETALLADAYSLGAHWVYDGKELASLDIDWQNLNRPHSPWHKGKTKGQFTHYGDHGSWLYEFVNQEKSFDVAAYRAFWLKKMAQYQGYIDASSRDTLSLLESNPMQIQGANSSDFSIIGRIAPLLLVSNNHDHFLALVKSFVSFTHNEERVMQAAIFFADILKVVLQGNSPMDAIKMTEANEIIKPAIEKGIASQAQNTFRAIRDFGPACGIEGALEGCMHLLSKYRDVEEALIENAKAGGDSAARGMVVGMIMGAAGQGAPQHWYEQCDYPLPLNT